MVFEILREVSGILVTVFVMSSLFNVGFTQKPTNFLTHLQNWNFLSRMVLANLILELEDLSAEYPGKVAELEAQWRSYAEYVGYIESDGTSAAAELGIDRFFEFRLADD